MIAAACTKKTEVKPPDPKTEKVPTLQTKTEGKAGGSSETERVPSLHEAQVNPSSKTNK